MKYDLTAMAAREGKRSNITLRPINPTQANAQDLARLYLAVLAAWDVDAIMSGYTGGLTTDAPTDQASAIERAEQTVTRLITEFASGLRLWQVRVERWHRSKWTAAVKAGTGLDIEMMLSAGEVSETLEVFLQRNVALVRNVSDQVRGRIADAVFRGYQERQPAREVSKAISEATGLARDRSLRIASDQNAKLSAALDRERQTEAGLDLYRWRHSGKLHPRDWHRARDGHIYDRRSGKRVNPDGSAMDGETVPPGDRPGEQPWCGCRAQAYLPIMAELDI